ncbi:MAG: MmgE/PrpD family protein [Burkholderiales bacterium]|nr:MmgE/PrpD family protein [Burkholderiales bacterium]
MRDVAPDPAPVPYSDLSARLAEFVAATRWADLPAEVRHEARRALLNFFAAALGGCRDAAIDHALALFGNDAAVRGAAVIGRPERCDWLDAALINAMSANVFDFDDTHLPSIVHPTAPVAPPLLALAERHRCRGDEFLLALVLGMEIECRLGAAVSPSHYRHGWHITSTCGVFGAAAASAKLLRLDAGRTLWALGNASAQSSGLMETLSSMSKSLGVGQSARNGLLSALLAERGFWGPARPLEGDYGFLRVTCEAPDLAGLIEGLGRRWEMLSNTYKPYPCGVVLNPVIEACLQLAADPAFAIADIERIELTGQPLLRIRTDRPNAASGREAQVSAQHAVAVALVHRKAGIAEFSDAQLGDPALRALGARLRFIDDVSFGVEAARVTLHMRDGRRLSRQIDAALGGRSRPLSDGDLATKLRQLAAYSGASCDAERLIAAIWSLDDADDAAALMRLAAGSGAAHGTQHAKAAQ